MSTFRCATCEGRNAFIVQLPLRLVDALLRLHLVFPGLIYEKMGFRKNEAAFYLLTQAPAVQRPEATIRLRVSRLIFIGKGLCGFVVFLGRRSR